LTENVTPLLESLHRYPDSSMMPHGSGAGGEGKGAGGGPHGSGAGGEGKGAGGGGDGEHMAETSDTVCAPDS
jgi:hypothetical protein